MRKFIIGFMISLTIILSACNKTTNKNNNQTTTTTSLATTQTTEVVKEPEIPYDFQQMNLLTSNLSTYQKAEWEIVMSGFKGNPYSQEDIDLIGEFTSPSGKKYVMPTFWYQDYNREIISLGDPLSGITSNWTGSSGDRVTMNIVEKEDVQVARVRFNAPNGEFDKIGKSVSMTKDEADKFTHVRILSSGDGAAEQVKFEFYMGNNSSVSVILDLNNRQLNEQVLELQYDSGAVGKNISQSTWMQFYPVGPMQNYFFIHRVELYNPTSLESKVLVDFDAESQVAKDPYVKEQVTRVGNPHFRLRFSPNEVGAWDVKLKLELEGRFYEVKSSQFTVSEESLNKGIIQVEPNNKRSFIYEDGSQYVPVGQNVAWWSNNDRKSYDYDIWYNEMAEEGANFSRVWLSAWGYSLFWGNYKNYDSRLTQAYQLDKQLELAENLGIYIDLVIFHHGMFSTNVDSNWSTNPFNTKKGGPLANAYEFFDDEEAIQYTKQYLRYLVARYGYSTHIFTWELFNEVQFTDLNYDSLNGNYTMTQAKEVLNDWHKTMSEYIKEIDPYNHLVTSSGEKEELFHSLDTIDFVAIHDYSASEFSVKLSQLTYNYFDVNKMNKPILMGELGITTQNANTLTLDPTGIHMHQAQWAGLMTGYAGPAHVWYWDQFTHAQDLYHYFKPISTYANEIDLGKNGLEIIRRGLTLSSSSLTYRGYGTNDTYYLWLLEKGYTYSNTNYQEFSNETLSVPIDNGTYKVRWLNTYTGEFIEESTKIVTEQQLTINIPTFSKDIAVIIEK